MAELLVAHTAELDAVTLDAAHALLWDVFDDMTPSDWEHALGGMHAIVREGKLVVGHASLIQRRLLHRGRALRAGYVEAVAVRADYQRQGHGTTMMTALERIIDRAYEVGALGASTAGGAFYAARGWRRWHGSTWVLAPTGLRRTPDDDDDVYLYPPTADMDWSGELVCDWRDGDPW